MNSTFLYIDPGTGSMLFSIIIGIAATVFFLFRALVIKIKFLLTGSKQKDTLKNPIVIYNEGKQYCKLFAPILAEAEKRGLPVLYLTSYEQDPALSAGWKSLKAEYIGEGNKAFSRLNFLSADVVLMTTPGLNVYQLKKSKTVKHYSHIVHMPTDTTTYRLFGLDYFDSVLLTGEYQKRDIRYLEQARGLPQKELVAVGCTYLDESLKNIAKYDRDKDNFTVLVSPSWGASGLLAKFGEKLLDPLVATDWNIIIRPHPQSKKSEAELLERLTQRYSDRSNVIWDYESDNMISMSKSNIMISDFSGIIFDYTFLFDNPLLYVDTDFDTRPYDMDDVPDKAWQFETIEKFGIKITEPDFANIKEIIQNASDSAELKAARETAKQQAWCNIGHSAQAVVDFLEGKITANGE